MKDRSRLTTEKRNPRSRNIDLLPSLGIVDVINSEDARVVPAVRRQRRQIARAVEMIVAAFRAGGRLLYVGAGTSGRLGVLDASECPPTFGSPRRQVQGVIAGGKRALVRAVEGAEDSAAGGAKAVEAKGVGPRDVVCGIAACGLTPFVLSAVGEARRRGAGTLFVTCSPQVRRAIAADVVICVTVGPEVVTGSTRMKAGTATKLVLNTLTTAAMIRFGKVCGNLMVDLKATNRKLVDRSRRIVMELTGLPRRPAAALLKRAGGDVKTAVVMHTRGATYDEAKELLSAAGGLLRKAMKKS